MAERKAKYNPEADRKWAEANKEHRRYLTDRTSARRFIRSKATAEDLDELEVLIAERRAELEKTTAQDSDNVEE
jgi:hypothetical protein